MWDISGLLTKEDRAQGFSLGEEEDFVQVFRHGELLTTFSSSGATQESIRCFIQHTLASSLIRDGSLA